MLGASGSSSSRNRRSVAVFTGRGAAWSAHLLGEQGVAGSQPAVPTTSTNALLSRATGVPHSAKRSTYLQARGKPPLAGELRREHIQAFLADQLARWKPATAHHRYRGLHALSLIHI